ncbi:hypothetical protein GCM10020001_039190 [Nonomuraea salmonea]
MSISTSKASGLLNRNISVATGVSASTAPASSPAPASTRAGTVPASARRTAAYTVATVATPITACGSRMLHEFTPNNRAVIAIGHNAAGVLSTVMALAASEEPKKNAFQLLAPACTAAE